MLLLAELGIDFEIVATSYALLSCDFAVVWVQVGFSPYHLLVPGLCTASENLGQLNTENVLGGTT